MPIGIAWEIGRSEGDLAVWRLLVHGADVPGRWVIVDRRFVPIENAPAGSRSGSHQDGPAASGDGWDVPEGDRHAGASPGD
jgi:hypothetical protein